MEVIRPPNAKHVALGGINPQQAKHIVTGAAKERFQPKAAGSVRPVPPAQPGKTVLVAAVAIKEEILVRAAPLASTHPPPITIHVTTVAAARSPRGINLVAIIVQQESISMVSAASSAEMANTRTP